MRSTCLELVDRLATHKTNPKSAVYKAVKTPSNEQALTGGCRDRIRRRILVQVRQQAPKQETDAQGQERAEAEVHKRENRNGDRGAAEKASRRNTIVIRDDKINNKFYIDTTAKGRRVATHYQARKEKHQTRGTLKNRAEK